MLSFIYHTLKYVFLLIAPFIMLIRGATYFHGHLFPSWLSLAASVTATAIIMFVYFSFFYGKLTGRFGNFNTFKRRAFIAFVFVAVYCLQGVLFFSVNNMKNPKLKNEISSLHPVLRLSLSTLVFVDRDLIITDASRIPEDYKKMGLKSKKASLHYKQKSSGYVHAVDLRTKGRSEVKNSLVKYYFKLMGFNTLRHTGTGDHLHISLLSHDRPGAK